MIASIAGSATSGTGSGGGGAGGGAALKIFMTTIKAIKVQRSLATRRRRGMQICHLEGFLQMSYFAGDQLGGGVSGSTGESSSNPISERLPLMVSLRVIGCSGAQGRRASGR